MKRGKSYRTARRQVDKNTEMNIGEALQNLDSFPKAKFDESVDCAVRLNVNPRHADQMVRGTVNLPHGTGKTARVLVFANGEKAEEARAAGADFDENDGVVVLGNDIDGIEGGRGIYCFLPACSIPADYVSTRGPTILI